MGVCETNSPENSGPSRHPRRRRLAPAPRSLVQSRAPPSRLVPDQVSQHERRTGCALDRPDLMGVRGHDHRVGQASDQASDVVGQAGAGSSRALRGKGTSTTASYEWATRAAGRQPAMPGRDEGNWDHRRGWPVTIRATLPAGTNPVRAQAGTAGSITVTNHITASELQPTLDARSRAEGGRSGKPCLPSRRWVPGPSWGRDTTVNNGAP
jgi:hypothetical protein